MPSKPFYSLEEVCARLGKSEDQIKQLVRDGSLREFRDAGKVFFKAEDIERLSGSAAPASADDTGEISLESGDDDTGSDLTPLSDSHGGTSIIGLEPLEDEPTSAAEPPAPSKKEKEDTVISASGIGVFDDDELEIDADPMAKTQITESATGDQVSLDGAGSGSGLLDLAREADDTALGADLLDEIYPGEEDAAVGAAAAEEEPEPAAAEAEPEEAEAEPVIERAEAGEAITPVYVATGDPSEGMLAGLLVGALILMGVATTVIGGVLQGFVPSFGTYLASGTMFYIFLGSACGLAVISLLVGWVIGRAGAPKRR